VTIPRENLHVKDTTSTEMAFPPQTPMWESAPRTPMRGDDVPQTPVHRSSGMMTPLRGAPATPSHGNAWDPTPNTPVRSSWDSGYNWEGTPSSEITTPGSYHPSSGSYPFSPASKVMDYSNSDHGAPKTPGSYGTPTTNFEGSQESNNNNIPSPYLPASTPTSGGPHTPNTPHTPGTPTDQDLSESREIEINWLSTDIEISVIRGQHASSKGVIRDVLSDSSCKVWLKDLGETITLPSDFLELVVPKKRDAIKIVGGEFKGDTGTLINIDGASDGIVKMDSNLDIKILDLHHLAHYIPQ